MNAAPTVSAGLLSNSFAERFSTHLASCSDVVACHRYKQLNWKHSSVSDRHACQPPSALTSTLQQLPFPRSKNEWSELRTSSNGFKLQLLPCRTRPRIAAT